MSDNQRDTADVQEDFAALFAASESKDRRRKELAVGDVVQGKIIAIGQNSAFIAVGSKGEAIMDLDQFRDSASGELRAAIDDLVEATVVDDGRKSGSIVLRRTMGRGSQGSSELEQAMATQMPVEGLVSGENKGGFDVQIGSARAFCPRSQIDLKRPGELGPASDYLGKRFQFRVTKVEGGGRNVVVSRRDLLAEERAVQAALTWEAIKPGAVITGTVTGLRDFGAFVDLGGVEGLVHVSELGYGRVKHPSDVVQPGQQVQVQILRVDDPIEGKRRTIALSLKALAADPWSSVADQFVVGSVVHGTVRRLEGFGAFIEIAPGLEGLAHISKLVLDRRVAHARQVLTIGQEVDATILSVDPQQRRISLSLVEQAKQARDVEQGIERVEEQAGMTQANSRRSLGTLGELLQKKR